MAKNNNKNETALMRLIISIFPFVRWFKNYSFEYFKADLIAGITVALVLIPQSMAYAQLANLPAYYGLYAAFLPPIVASLFGSSRQLATGPVAIVSLMTATALEPLATAGSESFIAYAVLLALIVGLFQLLLGVLRLGLIVNFLSHPVVNGFTNAAALIIASSQFSKLFGVTVEAAERTYITVYRIIVEALSETYLPSLVLAALAFAIMYIIKRYKPHLPYVLIAVVVTTIISWGIGFEKKISTTINNLHCPATVKELANYNNLFDRLDSLSQVRVVLNKSISDISEKNPENATEEQLKLESKIKLINLHIAEIKENLSHQKNDIAHIKFKLLKQKDKSNVFYSRKSENSNLAYEDGYWRIKTKFAKFDLNKITFSSGGEVVGNIPGGLPGFNIPKIEINAVLQLIPMALIITLLGFMEAISIAKAMAAKTKQQLQPNQELIGQGLSNIIGSLFSSYPVSGSFSRSAVNIQSGAITGFSSAFTAFVVLLTLLFLTPLLYYLPQSVLASIIILAVIGLLNVKGFIHAWKAQKYDGIISITTFVLTLYFAPELDVGIMIGVGLSLIWFLVRSTKPEIAMLSKHPDGTFRNRERFNLRQCKYIAVIRYNGSLFFANESYLDKVIVDIMDNMKELKHIIIVGNGINELDASGENLLSDLIDRIRNTGIGFSMTGLNDHVLDTMRRTFLYDKIGEENLYRNLTRAINAVHPIIHSEYDDEPCPLYQVVFEDDIDAVS